MAANRPWGVHTIDNIYGPDTLGGLPDGRWVAAVGLPYQGTFFERIRAAWWIVTGRAQAMIWPEPGDIERALHGETHNIATWRGDRAEDLERALGNLLMLNAVRDAAEKIAPLWLQDADAVFAASKRFNKVDNEPDS